MTIVNLNLIPVDETQLVLAAGDDTQLVLSAGDETQIVLSSVAISNGLMMTDGSNSALALGSAGTPSLKFAGDANTGIFSPGADQLSVTTGGTERLRVDGAGQIEAVSLGSAAAPTFSFTGDPNTGVYSPGADQLAAATNGVQRLTIDTAATTSTLPVALPLGAVATPSITFTGDLNTGFWSPTADTLAASTAGGERLRITSAGLVGIGTSTVQAGHTLQVNGVIASVTSFGSFTALQAAGGTGFRWTLANDGTFRLQRTTDGFAGVSSTPIMIDASSRVGIGTTNPAVPLDVVGQIRSVDGTVDTRLQPLSGSSAAIAGTWSNHAYVLYTNNTERLRISTAGNVGIGTSSPSVILDVRQNQAAYSYFDFYNTTAGGGIVWRQIVRNLADTGTTSIDLAKYTSGGFAIANNDTGAANFTAFNVGASERLRITSAGLVGIGTSSPGYKLDVAGSGTQVIRSLTTDTSGFAVGAFRAEYLGGGGGTNTAVELRAGDTYSYLLTSTNHPIAFGINSTERARIDSSGRLLVGTSSSFGGAYNGQGRLQVLATGYYTGSFYQFANDTNPAVIQLGHSRSTSVGGYAILQSGDSLGAIRFEGADGTAFLESASIRGEVDGTPGANDMPGRLIFATTADGATSPTERLRIKSTGIVNIANTPTYADNAAATAGGLVAGDIYRTSTGQLMIRY
jgi:hypothetical protein